jgi:hypothetical protein
MIDILIWIVAGFILIASIIDWKLKVLPSIFLTGMLFAIAFLNPANLWFGIMAFIIAYLLYESNFFSGVADIKVMTMIGFMISTTNYLFGLILLTVIFGFIWKVLIKWRLKKETDVAFIPVFLFCYLTLILLGGIA